MSDTPFPHVSPKDDDRSFWGLAPLMTKAYSGEDLQPLANRLLNRAASDAEDALALMDLSIILQLREKPEIGLALQAQALQQQQLYRLPAAAGATPIRLLALKGPGELMWNAPLEFLVQDTDVALDMLYVSPDLPFPSTPPEHDVMIVAAAQSDRNHPLLEYVERLTAAWPRPVLNPAHLIARLTRDRMTELLHSIPGLIMPPFSRIDRAALERAGQWGNNQNPLGLAGRFPILIRPVDSHAGRNLAKLDEAAAIPGYLETINDREFFLTPFVDYRGRDGQYRKFRIVMIEGRPYAGHMAISSHWMIHYLNAGMAESAEKRAEEGRFMAAFEEDFARRHAVVLSAIAERVGLDYFAIDCGETPDGRLLVFEVDSSMVVHAMDPPDQFPHKRPQLQKVFAAFRAMLVHAVERGGN